MHLTTIFILSHLRLLTYSLFGRYIYFSLFISITFEIEQTGVCIQNTNAHEVFSDSQKYFTFVIHISSVTSMTHDVFLILAVIFVLLKIPMMFHWNLLIFYIRQPYLSSDINNNLCILCLVHILCFPLALTFETIYTCASVHYKSNLIP